MEIIKKSNVYYCVVCTENEFEIDFEHEIHQLSDYVLFKEQETIYFCHVVHWYSTCCFSFHNKWFNNPFKIDNQFYALSKENRKKTECMILWVT